MGRLTACTDRNGREIVYSYDALDRRTEERWLDGASVVYTAAYAYDANDRLTNASDAHSAYAHTFDALGRVTRIDNAGTPGPHVVMDQTFDAVGNRTSVSATVNGTADFTNLYTFDNLDRQTRVQQTSQVGGNSVDDKRVDFAYNSLGQFTAITRFADLAGTQEVVKTTYSYDAIHRLTTLKHADGPTTRAQYTFTYNAASEITRIVSPDGTADYAHDATGQLTGANNSVLTDETYTYDANGNRIGGGYVVAPNNRILSDGTYTYEYDAEGNRTRRTHIATGEYESYTWDHRNRLTAVVKHAADDSVLQTASYTYDVFDRRIAKSVDADGDGPLLAALEGFAYDGDQIALAFTGDGSLTNRYLYGPAIDQILADEQHVDGFFERTLWALTDHLGTVRDLTDDTGSVLNHLTYSAFGRILSETAPLFHIRFAFTGRDFDPETGLSYHRARYYDPILGRWLSEDPIGFSAGDANLSRYVGNSSLTFIDSFGLEEIALSKYGVGARQLKPGEVDPIGAAGPPGSRTARPVPSRIDPATLSSIDRLAYTEYIDMVENTEKYYVSNTTDRMPLGMCPLPDGPGLPIFVRMPKIAAKTSVKIVLYDALDIGKRGEANWRDFQLWSNAAIEAGTVDHAIPVYRPYWSHSNPGAGSGNSLRDAIAKLEHVTAQGSSISALYILDHGGPSSHGLGLVDLTWKEVESLGKHVSPGGHLVLAGCMTGQAKIELQKVSDNIGRTVQAMPIKTHGLPRNLTWWQRNFNGEKDAWDARVEFQPNSR